MRRTLPSPYPPSSPASDWLRRDIVGVLVFKLAALVLLYGLFFGPAQRSAVDAGGMRALLTGAPTEAGASP